MFFKYGTVGVNCPIMGSVMEGGLTKNAREASQPYRHYPGRTVVKENILLYPGIEGQALIASILLSFLK